MNKWLIALLGSAAMTLSAGALAQAQTGWYVGAEIGQSMIDDDGIDEDDTAFKILGGYQLNRSFAVEGAYANLFDKDGVEVTAWELVAVGKFPINNQFSVFGKLGFAMWEADAGAVDDDGTDLTYGIGVQYDFSPRLGVRAQWQRYDVEVDLDLWTIGLVYRF